MLLMTKVLHWNVGSQPNGEGHGQRTLNEAGPHRACVCGPHFWHVFSKEKPSTSGLLTPRKANRRTALCVSVC